MDTGPVYGTVTEAIRPTDTAGDLLGRLASSGAELLSAPWTASPTVRWSRCRNRPTACQLRRQGDNRGRPHRLDAAGGRRRPAVRALTRTPAPGRCSAGDRSGRGPTRASPALPSGELMPGQLRSPRLPSWSGRAPHRCRLGTVQPARQAADARRRLGARRPTGTRGTCRVPQELSMTPTSGPVGRRDGHPTAAPARHQGAAGGRPGPVGRAGPAGRGAHGRRLREPRAARILAARRLSGRDAGLATDLAYGSCRALGQLDAIIAALLGPAARGPRRRRPGRPAAGRLPIAAHPHPGARRGEHHRRSGPLRPPARGGRLRQRGAAPGRPSAPRSSGWTSRAGCRRRPGRPLAVATAHPRWIAQAFADALGRRGDELAAALQADDQPPTVTSSPGRAGSAATSWSRRPVVPGRLSPLRRLPGRPAIPAGSPPSPTAGPRCRTRAPSSSRWRWRIPLDGHGPPLARSRRRAGRQGRPAGRAGRRAGRHRGRRGARPAPGRPGPQDRRAGCR